MQYAARLTTPLPQVEHDRLWPDLRESIDYCCSQAGFSVNCGSNGDAISYNKLTEGMVFADNYHNDQLLAKYLA